MSVRLFPFRSPASAERRPLPVVLSALAALSISLGLIGCGTAQPSPQEDTPPPNVVATFAGTSLTFDELKQRYQRSLSAEADDTAASFETYADFLERYIDFRLKVLDARARGIDQDSATVAELNTYRRQLARPYLIERQVVDSLVADLYEKQEVEIKAGHILALVRPGAPAEDTLAAYRRIHALHDSLVAGADFEELALRHSDDPSATQNRGVLGYFTGGRLIWRFEDRAYATPVGSFSEPFRTRFGYHILKVYDRRPYHPAAEASHILISTQDKSPEEALETARMLKERLDAGEDFATLARQYSNDPGSAENGGELGMVAHGRTVPPFEEALFALDTIGEISEPVQTRFGYHLIQLTGLQDRPDYEEAYPELKTLLNRLPRLRESELRMGRRYREQFGSALDSAAFSAVMANFPEDSVYFELRSTTLDSAYLSVQIGTIADKTYTVDQFRRYIRAYRPQQQPTTYAEMFGLVEDFLDAQAVEVAAERLEDLNPEFAELMREYEEGILLFAISEDSVWNAAARDTSALQRLYAQAPSQYTYPERRRVVSFTTRIDSTLQDLRTALAAGARLDAALERIGETPPDFRVDTTFVADSTQSLYDAALALEPGEVSAVIPFQGRGVLLFVDGIETPRQKTFEEARAEIVTVYQETLEEAWVDRLRERYDVRVYPEHLRRSLAAEHDASTAGMDDTAAGRSDDR